MPLPKRWLGLLFLGCVMAVSLGCGSKFASYPLDKVKDAISEICRKEYSIPNLEVKIVGKTVGVYLPLKKLFAADFKEAAVAGKIRNLETLFDPSPEALEKVEDVLFSISRVLLSTDKPLDFYVLQATDTEKTSLQLILTGYVDDIKRVRVTDISRNEYRRRVIHELKLNRAVKWHQPVREFFADLGKLPLAEIQKKYFGPGLTPEVVQTLFLNAFDYSRNAERGAHWEIMDMRSIAPQKSEVLVYAKVRSQYPGQKTEEVPMQFIFILSFNPTSDEARLVRIIPFQFRDVGGELRDIPLPPEFQIEKNLEHWEQEFSLEEVHLGDFLAQQITRRLQGIVAEDERVQSTFRDIKLNVEYVDEVPASFTLKIEASLRDFNNYSLDSLIFHEDMLYVLKAAIRELTAVVYSYHFDDYKFLSLQVAKEPSAIMMDRQALELFRTKKSSLEALLKPPAARSA